MSGQRPVLFVTNGHGEAAIAARVAAEVRSLAALPTDHFPLVGEGFGEPGFLEVGPRRRMPSGGLVAMGNVAAFGGDVRAGWFGLFAAQVRFLRAVRRRVAAVVAVGDVYAFALAAGAGRPLFVGTAKSVAMAPYGPFERLLLRGARRIFVRDEPTAAALRSAGLRAESPGNVIVDLLATERRYAWPSALRVAVLPGSRAAAYADAERLVSVLAEVAARRPDLSAGLSIAPGLDPAGFAPLLARYPWLGSWGGPIGGLLAGATLALGQAGTANEAAAACGVPVVALEAGAVGRRGWYRARQVRLLGEALLVVPGEPAAAAAEVSALLADDVRRAAMSAAGRARMGPPGGALAIARAIAAEVG